MRIIFMGTPDFSVPVLDALQEAGHEICAVYTQPPRPAGRGKKLRPSPVQTRAEALGLEVRHPVNFAAATERKAFAALEADIAVVVAYGLLLPVEVLTAPKLGCVNVHASLLPRWRGAAPIQRAIESGDPMTGVTIMQMEQGLDTGDMLLRDETSTAGKTSGDLHVQLAQMGARLMVNALSRLSSLTPLPQDEIAATYAAKIDKSETRLDFTKAAGLLEREVRAFAPFPGAWFELDGARIKLLRAEVVDGRGAPGTVLDERLTIACGDRALRPVELQRAGKPAMGLAEFLRGNPVAEGTVLA
ncbi:methionyl-tRNA formyltransferase [Aurantiacibacter xanthus]|uniref:Methionyl-tRNA formyltransferase n=1 Tax=Aurantiacibacter xanthus TaxID=1784712 RepID=A0A3A1PBI0_9SPHN|nr:methionyl-tRNA formyltransferase [Aurantiacibacter xanthus]RIV91128.1 methionyl-tRNA formyltransferase [Aurantiacibacter xanthus]